LDGSAGVDMAFVPPHRVLVVDDRPEIRLLIRTRLRMLDNVEIVGEASNGEEALILVSALAPEAVVLDLEMPVMRGDEAIPKIRELAPGVRILLYTGADQKTLDGIGVAAQPDAVVSKGGSLTDLVDQLQALLEMGPHDVLRVVLGSISLDQAVTAFDTWVGLNVRILDSLARGDELRADQLGGATLEELQALMGVYAHLGDNLQKAARERAVEVVPIVHILRSTAAAARRALLAFSHVDLRDFYAAWNYEVPPSAVAALSEMRTELIEALPTSSADEAEGEEDSEAQEQEAASESGGEAGDRALAAVDRAAAKIDRAAAAQDRAAASVDELTGAYLRGPGHIELKREIARARRTQQPLALAFLDVDGLKTVNDASGHGAGDRLLREIVGVLRARLRDYDVIVRQGGDEFVCALPGMSMAEAEARLGVIQEALSAGPEPRSVTAGIAVLEDEDTLESLIARADEALYQQRSGRPRN
jgi:diguanylate cyclase (GGDEF)-like protein